jgi:hypothetical protein
MRSAGNFRPEWGYLTAGPSLLHGARVALIATGIGATAGIVVMVALTGADIDTSIAVHALVTGPRQPVRSTSVLASVPIASATGSPPAPASTATAVPQSSANFPAQPPEAPPAAAARTVSVREVEGGGAPPIAPAKSFVRTRHRDRKVWSRRRGFEAPPRVPDY